MENRHRMIEWINWVPPLPPPPLQCTAMQPNWSPETHQSNIWFHVGGDRIETLESHELHGLSQNSRHLSLSLTKPNSITRNSSSTRLDDSGAVRRCPIQSVTVVQIGKGPPKLWCTVVEQRWINRLSIGHLHKLTIVIFVSPKITCGPYLWCSTCVWHYQPRATGQYWFEMEIDGKVTWNYDRFRCTMPRCGCSYYNNYCHETKTLQYMDILCNNNYIFQSAFKAIISILCFVIQL